MENKMKVAVSEGRGDIKLVEIDIPEIDDYQCLCKTLSCATCSGTDLKIINSKMFWAKNYPVIVGHESVGQVIKKGKKVRYIEEGDIILRPTAVYAGQQTNGYFSALGGFAEYGVITDLNAFKEDNPGKEFNNYCIYQLKLPSDIKISPADATMLITAKETAGFLFNIGVKLNSSILILGSGAVSMNLCYFSKILGCFPVIIIGRNQKTLEYIKNLGADWTINTKQENFIKKVKEITEGKGVDFVIDTTGNKELVVNCLEVISEKGGIAPYASYEEEDVFGEYKEDNRFIFKSPGECETHNYLCYLLRMNLIELRYFYSNVLPFSEIEYGFKLLKEKKAFKIVFEM
ncbi:MAG TPA: zinc-binding dehydrogenase [Candidatus Ratteibacteria bacterium]|nr:zinc-binding dehydrogenase [bacterium]HRR95707.1 zinc-binding dehydrogenase [Candidatus Ratteibacteria bacterium]